MPLCFVSLRTSVRPCFHGPANTDLLSIAARIGDESVHFWVVPEGDIAVSVSKATLIIKRDGGLVNKERNEQTLLSS
jgi:hypothetical protein